MTTTWWGITILCVVCAAVWILLSALLYRVFFKRFYDILLSFIAIIVLSPLLLVLTIVGAIAMKGNPFFVQKRPGRRKKLSKKECTKRGVPYGTYGEEKIFKLVKFRTMTNEKDESGNLLPDKQRLNGYGKFLRSTSCDELPSLFNIFAGSLSIVGPRPLLERYLPYYTEEERHRHDIRSGLTGLAQVNGRNYLTWEKIFEYDLYYIKTYSLWLDIKIIFLTARKVLLRKDISEITEGGGKDETGREICDTFDVERAKQNKIARKEIGSSFFDYKISDILENAEIGVHGTKYTFYFKSGRNAIKALCKTLFKTNRKVLLPIYTCGTVIQPFIDEGWQVFYYDINKDLTVNEESLTNKMEESQADVIFLQSYFGFDTLKGITNAIESYHCNGKIIIEDITHSLFATFEKIDADYYVGSLRKFFAISDGGILQTNHEGIGFDKVKVNEEIETLALKAFNLKKDYLLGTETNAEKEAFREAFARHERIIDDNSALCEISNLAMKILNGLDTNYIRAKRISNYRYLSENGLLSKISVMGCLGADNVPLFYPIYLNTETERNDLQVLKKKKKIYCPVIWPEPETIGEEIAQEGKYIYNHILCIPIDQRYDKEDMNRIINAITNFYEERIGAL